MMNVIIVDDEQAGRRTLREFCEAEGDLHVVGEYGDGVTALAAIRAQQPHLLFLDIQMDPLNGIELARSLEPSQLPSLVFVTAYDAYALEAFEVSAIDYLLKPFDQERFRRTLERVRHAACSIGNGRAPGAVGGSARATRTQRPPCGEERPRLLAEFGGHLRVLEAAQVEMIEADRNYVVIRVGQGQLPRPQHPATGGTGAALSAHAAHQPFLPGQYELRQGSESYPARRLHSGAGGRRHRHEQRRISRQGQGLLEHPANFVEACLT